MKIGMTYYLAEFRNVIIYLLKQFYKGSDESTIILALRFQTVADLSNSEETTAERRFILQRAYNEKLTAAVSLSKEFGSVEFFCDGDPPLVEIDTTE